MPYIKPKRREEMDKGVPPETPGELNYLITHQINKYLFLNGMSYQTINDILGALSGVKGEFYARVARPYEDKKIKENGDVYNV